MNEGGKPSHNVSQVWSEAYLAVAFSLADSDAAVTYYPGVPWASVIFAVDTPCVSIFLAKFAF